jgi:exodeoxyribonuclease-1
LYDGFFDDDDRKKATHLRKSEVSKLDKEHFLFQDSRLNALLPLYKARNYPKSLSDAERKDWEVHCQVRVAKQLPKFSETLENLLSDPTQSKANQYLLEELRLYAQSILH